MKKLLFLLIPAMFLCMDGWEKDPVYRMDQDYRLMNVEIQQRKMEQQMRHEKFERDTRRRPITYPGTYGNERYPVYPVNDMDDD